jgi:hypothetical protein
MKKFIIAFALLGTVSTGQGQNHNEANYDESKVPAYTLPDVLQTTSNTKVTSKTEWEKVRRPQVVKLFEDNIYGQIPKTYSNIRYTVTNQDASAMNGKAKLKEVLIITNQLK